MKRLLTLVLMATMLLPMIAQKRDVTLTIEVTTTAGVPVTDATLKLTHTGYSLTYGTLRLNAEGRVTVRVYKGDHSLLVTKDGYQPSTTEFTANADTTISVQLAEAMRLPYALTTTVTHNAHTGLNDVLLTWNQEPPVFFDDFESYDAFSIKFGEWTGIDGDGLMTAPLVGDYVNRGVMQYAQIINPMVVQPAWWYDYPILRPYSGQQYVGFTRTYSGAANDDWLITPVITPGNENVFSFLAKAADQYREKFQVYITENVDNPGKADFTMINGGNYETVDYTGWREFSYDLSAWAGKPVKLAIRYISEYNQGGSFMLMVDDVFVGQDFESTAAPRRTRRVEALSPTNPIESFKVYLNGTMVGQTEDFEYYFNNLAAGTYEMGVQAVYPASTTETVTTTVVITDETARVTAHVTTNNGADVDGNKVEFIERNTLVIGLLTQSQLFEKTISNMAECKSRGAYLMGVTSNGNYTVEDSVNFTVYIPKTDEHFASSLAVVPLQLLGYYTSVNRGLDVDKPRNLAKSVTVE